MKQKFLFLAVWVLSFPFAYAQDIPKDTSFTVFSAWQKISKEFKNARPAFIGKSKLVTEDKDIVYRDFGNRKLHLDIYYPGKRSKQVHPAVLLIHGGGWRSGDKTQMEPLARCLANAGYVAIDAEYRLSIEALYPAGIYDLKEAVRFIKANSQKYSIDTTKIAAGGCSAGATLASFLGTTGNQNRFDDPVTEYPKISSRISGIINIDGIVDFTDPAESAKDENPAKPSAGALWFGGTFKEIPEKWKEASPLNYVDNNTPPVIFINSALPRYHAGRDIFLEKLKPFNIYSEVHTIENTPHSFFLFDPWFGEMEKYVVKFLEKIF